MRKCLPLRLKIILKTVKNVKRSVNKKQPSEILSSETVFINSKYGTLFIFMTHAGGCTP